MPVQPSAKYPPDTLPGAFDRRVFIGGNYDNMVLLRKIKKIVAALGYTAILPRDDVAVPVHDMHDWDLRILHNCRFAVFEVSVPAGELMEVERVRDYGTLAVLIYQSREAGSPEHITKMIRTCKLPLKGYSTEEELEPMLKEFFSPSPNPEWDTYLRIFGYSFDKLTDSEQIEPSGIAREVATFEGLQATGEKPVTAIQHGWELTTGEIIDVSLRQTAGTPERIGWRQTRKDRAAVEGQVRIDPPLKKGDQAISYEFTVATRDAYCFTRTTYKAMYPDDPSFTETFEKRILYPTRELVLRVKVPEDYAFHPTHSVLYGDYIDTEAASSPTVSFQQEGPSVAKLTALWPKPLHRYIIGWELEEEA